MIPYNVEHYITSFLIAKNLVAIQYRIDGLTRIGYFLKNQINLNECNPQIHFIKFDESVYTVEFSDTHNLDFESDEIIFTYESITTPSELIALNTLTKSMTTLHKECIPTYDSSLYGSMHHQIKSHDGKMIPCFMAFKKNMFKNGTSVQPLYLYGYGAYGVCINPEFTQSLISLMDRGWIVCYTNIRGGSEKGYDWYLDGKMFNKMNTFKDFIACAEAMITRGYTSPKLMVAEGRSAGGLLMGSVLTQRPDLFQAMHLGVPFVDVLVTMSDPSIPLTTPEWEEWGNPNIQEYLNYMSKYSPIDSIKNTIYPNTLITCGLWDPRVMYWEPVKFQLKLKEHAMDNNEHLLKIDVDQGHFSNTNRYKLLEEKAFVYAFFIKSLNKT